MLYSTTKNEWTNKNEKEFFEAPEFKTNYHGIIHGGMRLETLNGLFDIKEVDRILYREDKLNFGSGTWYLLCATFTGFQFRIEL